MCRNCQVICWERREDREENRRLLMNSGIVVLTPEGKRTAVPQEQAAEVETSRLVRVAVPHQDTGTRWQVAQPGAGQRCPEVHPHTLTTVAQLNRTFFHSRS